MQIFDGSFPSGMFVHSFGLEPHIVKEKALDEAKLKFKDVEIGDLVACVLDRPRHEEIITKCREATEQ